MRRSLVPLLVLALLAAAGCGSSGDDNGEQASGGGTKQVKVGVIPILDVAPIYLGKEKGFFSKRGIELTLETGQGGAAIVPGVVSGQFQFGFSNVTSLLIAQSRGLPLKVVSNGVASTGKDKADYSGIVTRDDAIKTAADLEGKQVSVNTLKNIGDSTIRASVRKAGGDPSSVKFVELAFPDMPAALEAGNVDAVWVPEPFMSGLVKKGEHLVGYTSKDSVPGLPTQFIFTSAQMMKSDPKLVADMTAALEETLTYADENPDQVRDAASKLTKMDRGLLDTIKIDSFGTDLRLAQVNKLGELMQQDGLIEKPAGVKGLMP